MTERRRLIAGNWKMYKTREEAFAFAQETGELLARLGAGAEMPEAVICAPFTALLGLGEALAHQGIGVGAQNMHAAAEGAYTGEVSVRMLQELGCRYVIVGHSERRAYFAEADAAVAQKAAVALQAGIAPIVCVGESLTEREAGETEAVIRTQLDAVLGALRGYSESVTAKQGESLELTALVIAYEPIWAIGTGKSSSAEDAQQVIGQIRSLIADALGNAVASAVRILYGGSVKPDNIALYLHERDIDGVLVGGASLQPASFVDLLRNS